jgi:L-ascorbate metabolism protein UlaG (beta-lactamase superfamily)
MASSSAQLFLRPDVVVEPLVDRWHAWPHLIPPATAARNLTQRHLPIMESYISNPEAHANAARVPALAGGPFVNYERNQVGEIMRLLDQTKRARGDLIELSGAIAECDALLEQHATGCALESLYQLVPPSLAGYVELAYDLSSRPSFRLIEPLLYRSRYYEPSAQSFAVSTARGDDRSFIFSTPRLDDGNSFHWPTRFDHEAVDSFFKLRTKPSSYSDIMDLLGASAEQRSTVNAFLTDQKPPAARRFEGPGLRWRYFGHACVLVETRDGAILTDPVVSCSFPGASARFTYHDLPDFIDFVLLTHAHQDHVLLETLLQLRHRIGTILVPRNSGGYLQDPSLKLILQACGFRRVVDLAEMEEVAMGSGAIQAIPFTGEHCDLDIRSKTAWLLRFGQRSILFAADARNVNPDLYQRVQECIGDVETMFVGMECDGAPLSWIYGPLLTKRLGRSADQSRRANASDYASALSMVERFNSKEVYVYAMGQEPWLNFVSSIHYDDTSNPIVQSNQLMEVLHGRGITAERLFGWRERILR